MIIVYVYIGTFSDLISSTSSHSEESLSRYVYEPLSITRVDTETGVNVPNSSSGSSMEIAQHDSLMESIRRLSPDDQLTLCSDLISSYAVSHYGINIPSDFLKLAVEGMKNLLDAGKVNIIYNVSKGFGVKRPDKSDTLFPICRMPYGLLQYMTEFFISKPNQLVS